MIAARDHNTGAQIAEDDLLNYTYMIMEFGHSGIAIMLIYASAVLATHQDFRDRLGVEHGVYSDEAKVFPSFQN